MGKEGKKTRKQEEKKDEGEDEDEDEDEDEAAGGLRPRKPELTAGLIITDRHSSDTEVPRSTLSAMGSARLIFLLLLVATGANAFGEIVNSIRIGLKRVEDGIFNFLFPTRGPTTTKESFSGLYVGTIELGTGFKQKMNVLFDINSSLMWVTSNLCQYTDYNAACKRNNKYRGWLSRTYKRLGTKFDYPYNSTERVAGFLSLDVVTVGNIEVYEQIFGEATSVPTNSPVVDGVVGLGFSMADPGLVSPLVYTMINQALLPKPVFSLYHNKNSGGQLLLGEVDSSLFQGSLTYVNATGPSWGFMLNRVEVVGAILLCRNTCRADLSTTASRIEMPKEDLQELNKRIGATSYKGNIYQVDCDVVSQLPNVTFVSGNSSLTLNSNDYIMQIPHNSNKESTTKICLTMFGVGRQEDVWSLGMSFLEKFYIAFDLQNRRIGMAP
ncbi:lysosomal aspartic protease-like, partial [Periplaneta americana]|uniref:lysosomal aspartic protease-like n=1 Tax=Periplaneta americana TaxID=6978 RepID=UPI0037E80217